MGDVVSFPISLDSDLGREWILDLARYRENLLDESSIRKKYRLADDVWEKLGDDDGLVRKVEAESARRIRDGSCKRERAQALVVKAPDVLSGILLDSGASPKHRIDACKVLDSFTGGPESSAPAADRFVITINLGSDVLHFNKSRTIDPNDDTPQEERLPVIAASKKDDGGGNTL